MSRRCCSTSRGTDEPAQFSYFQRCRHCSKPLCKQNRRHKLQRRFGTNRGKNVRGIHKFDRKLFSDGIPCAERLLVSSPKIGPTPEKIGSKLSSAGKLNPVAKRNIPYLGGCLWQIRGETQWGQSPCSQASLGQKARPATALRLRTAMPSLLPTKQDHFRNEK